MEFGMFSTIYGRSLRNKVIENILERGTLDFAVSELVEEVEISKPKVYKIIKELEEENIIKKTRIISKTQLYQLNVENKKTKLLIRSFQACIKLILEENKENIKSEKKISQST